MAANAPSLGEVVERGRLVEQIKADLAETVALRHDLDAYDANTADNIARAQAAAQAVIDAGDRLRETKARTEGVLATKRADLAIARRARICATS